MVLTLAVILVVSGALVAGAAWGIFGRPGEHVEGFVVAISGGALMVAAALELVDPATETSPLWAVALGVLAGALTYAVLDAQLERRLRSARGTGLLLAIILDGIPENLAMGVALIGSSPLQVAALCGAIFLSNLPEAAGGAREMVKDRSPQRVFVVWGITAAVLALAALAGNLLFTGVPESALGLVQAFAGGAVVASLAIEVFPEAYDDDSHRAGVATAIGFVLAILLDQLG